MLFFWISLIIILILIGLVIWLLVRTFTNDCPTTKKLNDTCSSTTECTGGLICSNGNCKVSFGQTCENTDNCADGLSCENGICTAVLGKVSEGCPCDTGHTCVDNVCKVIVGGICTTNSQCATNMCQDGICIADLTLLVPGNTDDSYDSYDDDICYSSDYSRGCKTSSKGTEKCSSKYYTCSDTDCSKTKYYNDDNDYSEMSYISNYTSHSNVRIAGSDNTNSCKSSSYTIDMSETD